MKTRIGDNMTSEILIECFVPVLNKSFDARIPVDKTINEILQLLSKSICDLSGGLFIADDEVLLCDYQSGKSYNINLSVKEQGLQNGSKLMLI